jgi:hypothetical protein
MGDSTAIRWGQCANFFRASTTANPAGVMTDRWQINCLAVVPGELAAAFRVLRRTLIGFCSEREWPRQRATEQRSLLGFGLSRRQ